MFILKSNAYRKYKRIWNYLGGSLLVFYTIFMIREFVCLAVKGYFTAAFSSRAGEIANSISGAIMYMLAFIVPVFFYKLISKRLAALGDLQLGPRFNKYLWLVIPAALAANLVLAMLNSLIMLPFNYEVIYELMTPEYPDGYYLYHLVLDIRKFINLENMNINMNNKHTNNVYTNYANGNIELISLNYNILNYVLDYMLYNLKLNPKILLSQQDLLSILHFFLLFLYVH